MKYLVLLSSKTRNIYVADYLDLYYSKGCIN